MINDRKAVIFGISSYKLKKSEMKTKNDISPFFAILPVFAKFHARKVKWRRKLT